MMTTFGGERISLTQGAPSLFTVGVSLGRIARFCGHTKEFYPVLAHSFVVASIMPKGYGIYGVMHDAQESLFADVPTPMKSQVARNREHRVLERIYQANGLGFLWPLGEEIQEMVAVADEKALIAEANVLEHAGDWPKEFDKDAGYQTRFNAKLAVQMLEAEYSGYRFVRTVRACLREAGLNPDVVNRDVEAD